MEKQNTDLQTARGALSATTKPQNVSQTVRDDIASAKNRLEMVNQNIKDVSPVAAEVAPLAQVLVHLLRRHEGLTLVRTSAVAPEFSSVKSGQTGALPVGLTRQGVELTVSGPYPELVRYVQVLEGALPNLRWGVMKLKSEKLPPELTLQLYVVGVQP